MADDSSASEWPPHIVALYQGAAAHLRFMKRQQWAITNYLIAILAGIFAVSRANGCIAMWEKGAAIIIIVGALAGALHLLITIQCHMTEPRVRSAKIHSLYLTCEQREELDLKTKPTHWARDLPFLISLILVCIIGALIIGYAVATSAPCPISAPAV